MDREHNHEVKFSPILIGLCGILSGAIMVATLHCIAAGCRSRSGRFTNSPTPGRPQNTADRRERTSGTPNSTVIEVPLGRYSKECNEEICSVCLCEFNEGEQIRELPECLHMFHVSCIDMWLNSHSNCPICRTITVSTQQNVVVLVPDSGEIQLRELHQQPDFGV
ncbi:hypothetical protein P3X46_004851 [Hevea brasiliensis]|uniref:RING-type E3 ubiquitin transferase n=2 Tax=Hevea brasiliensis TaxID=3981 RepID=A0ABQ9MYU9_HEVBR|nr:hypothetical protein P3X46_004851 [Hevea brasiliensis]